MFLARYVMVNTETGAGALVGIVIGSFGIFSIVEGVKDKVTERR